jgi:EmrB/QacA subfamily drug resistance transporter
MSSAQTNIHSIHSRGRSGQRRLGLALVVICTAQLMLVLDETIVNTALPHVQRALAFSGNSLEWVVNAYALTFGGLLLLGGRAGDILGRRRIFITGIALFSTASLFGGLATAEWWLLAARAIQGTGAAIAAPAALALIATTFPRGQPRNRALGVYAAMTGAGGSIGLLAGGLLTTYASWRWVFFVNVPIGLMLAVAAPSVIPETPGHRGRFDLPGALTGTAGFSLLVYGLTRAATGPDGISHWTDTPTIAALAGAAVLLVSFTVIEWRSRHALLPLRLFASRDRSGTYVIIMCLGTAIFGMFFFLTIFMQTIWGYSALRAGAAYLPLSVGIILVAGVCSRLVSRIGARPLLLAGTPLAAAGMFWLSRIDEHPHYASDMLGPMLLAAVGLGMIFVPLTTTVVAGVQERDAGVASSLFNVGQQVGGSIGLATLGTVAWTTVNTTIKHQLAHAAAVTPGHPLAAGPGTPIYDHAISTGFSRGLGLGAGAALLALLITLIAIRVRRTDLSAASQLSVR